MDELCELRERAVALAFHGLASRLEDLSDKDWPQWLLQVEEEERGRRSLERRIKAAKLGRYKPLVDFDWAWPKRLDRPLIDALFKLKFVEEGANRAIASNRT